MVEDIQGRGALLALVGNGSVDEARQFRDEQRLTTPLFTDPSLGSYRCAELRHGVVSSLSPRVFGHGLKAFAQGYRQTTTQGSALQQGGAFVIAKGGRLLFEFASREAGDHPDPKALIEALDQGREAPLGGG